MSSPSSTKAVNGVEGDHQLVVIVGIGCRLPGDISSPADFWKFITARRSAGSSGVPASRFNINAYFHPNNERPGGFNVPGGYFLRDNLQDFNPTMFNISPVEAAWMDPQQKQLLEVVYEAIENSGCTLSEVSEAVTGCFVGSFTNDFQQMALKEPDFRHTYATTGIDPGILGNRISHVFNLRGPSCLINTACSSSMYALHSACTAIRNGECEGAIVGGSNLILTVDQHMNTAKLGVLSPTTTCHTFDQLADGYARAEGVGAFYIKSLSSALKNRDPIRAIIRSTATNCNGKVVDSGITHPSLQGQVDVISAAYSNGNIDPSMTSYVECHGTGTPAGDPVEVHAISIAMKDEKRIGEPILLGSVKPNVGHSEAASSMATIMKAVLAIESNTIPPTIGLSVPNKNINWADWPVAVVTKPTSFSSLFPVRRIGINAFGYGGTNGHAIIDNIESVVPEYQGHKSAHLEPNAPIQTTSAVNDRAYLLLFSAHDKATLRQNLIAYSSVGDKIDLLDLAYTLGSRRTKHSCRTFAVCRKESYSTDLATATGSIVEKGRPPTIAFVFTGQGAQWPRMGATLFGLCPLFDKIIQELDSYLAKLEDPPNWTIRGSLLEPDATSLVSQPRLSQPLCTAIQIALVTLLNHWGVVSVAAVGHSSGEIAAAYAAGYLSAEDAIIAAYYRGRAVHFVESRGAMLAVGLGAGDVSHYIDRYGEAVVIACYNSPSSTTLSGDEDVIVELKTRFDTAGVFARILKTGGRAYHSYHMEQAAQIYDDQLKTRRPDQLPSSKLGSSCQMISSVTGKLVTENELDTRYWTTNLTNPVLFKQAIEEMMTLNPSINLVVEIGPHAALSEPVRQICAVKNLTRISYHPTLTRYKHDLDQLLRLAGDLWARDASFNIGSVVSSEYHLNLGSVVERKGSLLVDLPPYQWNHTEKGLLEPRQSYEHRTQKHPRHDILGRRIVGLSNVEPVWRNILRHRDLPWLKHHFLGGESIFPAAAYIAMAIEAIRQANSMSGAPRDVSSYTLRNVVISAALVVPDEDEGVETLSTLRPLDDGPTHSETGSLHQWFSFSVASRSFGTWKTNMRGNIAVNVRMRGQKPASLPVLPIHATYGSWNQRLRDLGFDFGPSFQCITDIVSDGKSHAAASDFVIKQTCGTMYGESDYLVHPGCLDSVLQLFLVSIYAGKLGEVSSGTVLTHFDEVSVWPPRTDQLLNPRARAQAWTSQRGNRAFLCNAQLVAHDGELLANFSNVRCLSYEVAVPQHMQNAFKRDQYFEWQWKPDIAYFKFINNSNFSAEFGVIDLIDLLIHKDAALDILCLEPKLVPIIIEVFPSLRLTVAVRSQVELQELRDQYNDNPTISIGKLGVDDKLVDVAQSYQLVLSTEMPRSKISSLMNIRHWLEPGGFLLLTQGSGVEGSCYTALQAAGFAQDTQTINVGNAGLSLISLPTVSNGNRLGEVRNSSNLLLVYREEPTSFLAILTAECTKAGWTVRSSPIGSARVHSNEQLVMLADLERPFLATLIDEELQAVKSLIETAGSIVWTTCGDLLSISTPEYAMTSGFARAVRSEKQSLDLVTLDFDSKTKLERVIAVITDILSRQAEGRTGENEYCIRDNTVHVPRLVPSVAINEIYATAHKDYKIAKLEDSQPLKGVLQSGKILHQADDRTNTVLAPDYVEIKVMAVGVNREDSLAISGSDYSTTFSHEAAGIITEIGYEVTHLKVGDRVTGFAFETFSTYQRTPAKLVQAISGSDSFMSMATLPVAFSMALYGLKTLARIQPDEVVLILDGSGSSGLAALQLCQVLKAKLFVVTNSINTERMLENSGLASTQIILSSDKDITTQIQQVTAGRGADVVFGCGFVEPFLWSECLRSVASFARVINIGRTDALRSQPLDTSGVVGGCSFFSFELNDLYQKKPDTLASLLENCMEMHKKGIISSIESVVCRDISEVNEAINSFSNGLDRGKSIITYKPNSLLKVLPTRTALRFRPDATYLLVGCLGGLGRSLTTWMVERGAKHLAFMSRSGAEKPSAASLVTSLRAQNVNVLILRADVTCKSQVEAAVQNIDPNFPVRGVVNAAVILEDTFFQNMRIDQWHSVVDPKLKGSMNLHRIFSQADELDFFVMTSSIAATLGSTGQSNYAAANAFLDTLANHRRALGLPAFSLILPMIVGIGYIAENPEVEASIRRKGMYGINETEMLAAFEIAMTPNNASSSAPNHTIAGLEPLELAKAIASTNADVFWLEEPRFQTLAALLKNKSLDQMSPAGSSGGGRNNIIQVVERAKTPEEAISAVTAHLVQGLSRLLMLDAAAFELAETKSIASYGLDSMIGMEFRNWVFREFNADVPFQRLLAENLTVERFATDLCGILKEKMALSLPSS